MSFSFTLYETITIIIGISGLLVSAVFFFIKRRIRIKVRVQNGCISGMFSSTRVLAITAANIGTRATSLGTTYLLFPRFKMPLMGPYVRREAPNPYEIAPGKRDLDIYVSSDWIANGLTELGISGEIPFRVVISGAGGKQYKSKKKLLRAELGQII
jgi:hypothetical protein